VTPWHVVIIIAALVVPIVCGLHPTCQTALPQILDLSKIAIVGTLGHAGQSLRQDKPEKRNGT
jgi:hypothetical protein